MIPKVKDKFDILVIDGAIIMEQRSLTDAIKIADLLLIPAQPSGLDVWGTSDLVEIIKTRQFLAAGRPQAAFVVSQQIPGTRFAAGIRARLEQMALPVLTSRLTQRIDFAEAATAGQYVLDYRPRGRVAQEIRALTHENIEVHSCRTLI